MSDPFDLQRFVDAQEAVIDDVRAELSAGRKRSHWIWFVFPQFEGLGHSQMSRRYAIRSCAEAEAYLAHPTLGSRLLELTTILNHLKHTRAEDVFGYPDDLKFHSSMTLFAHCAADPTTFEEALTRYFGGRRDEATLKLCGESR
jgi:uncharacterized protein (DUF1810 family)